MDEASRNKVSKQASKHNALPYVLPASKLRHRLPRCASTTQRVHPYSIDTALTYYFMQAGRGFIDPQEEALAFYPLVAESAAEFMHDLCTSQTTVAQSEMNDAVALTTHRLLHIATTHSHPQPHANRFSLTLLRSIQHASIRTIKQTDTQCASQRCQLELTVEEKSRPASSPQLSTYVIATAKRDVLSRIADLLYSTQKH